MQKISITIALLMVLGGAIFFLLHKEEEEVAPVLTEEVAEESLINEKTIGESVEGRSIVVHTYGNGEDTILIVGGIHGGYEWNSVLLAYGLMDYLDENINTIPDNLSIAVIPSANPDGLYKVVNTEGRFRVEDVDEESLPVGTGRFNANEVDLNRNFDCKWKPESMWRGNVVSAGSSAFSEPEAIALRDYVLANKPIAGVFLHSQANAVYASECEEGILKETISLMNTYAESAGYQAIPTFDAYEVTGDVEGWLASIGIPAITVELATHEEVEFEKNLKGLQAILEYYEK